MDISLLYAIAIGGVFCLFLMVRALPFVIFLFRYLFRYFRYLSSRVSNFLFPRISKYFLHTYVVRRHRLLGPWNVAGVIAQLIYIAGNLFCLWAFDLSFRPSTISEAGLRAGTLSVINLIPLFASPHLSLLADILGVKLAIVQQIHSWVGVVSALLALFHVLVAIATQPPLNLAMAEDLFAVIVCVRLAGRE